MARKDWTEEEMILSLDLYYKLPFSRINKNNPEVQSLAALIGRTSSSVALRLANYAACDPYIVNSGRKGMTSGIGKCKPFWDYYASNMEELFLRAETIKASMVAKPIEDVLDINPSDLRVDRYRSQGAGGQNVNKTESAVRITHIPTGIVVSCQTQKSQIQNHEICMQMLASKLAQLEEEKKSQTEAQFRSKIGSGDRNEKIRTYNYPQNRVTDHRIGFTIQQLDRVMEGDLDNIIDALINFDQEQKIAGNKDGVI